MDVIDELHAAVNASGTPKKTIAERAGLADASALSRILHKRVKPRQHHLEAIAAAIGRTLSSFYVQEQPLVNVSDAHQALRVLTDFVKQHETPAARAPAAGVAAKPKRATSSNKKSRTLAKPQRSRVVRPFHVAANPNAILLNSEGDDD